MGCMKLSRPQHKKHAGEKQTATPQGSGCVSLVRKQRCKPCSFIGRGFFAIELAGVRFCSSSGYGTGIEPLSYGMELFYIGL